MNRSFRVDACNFIEEILNERVDLRKSAKVIQIRGEGQAATNLSIVCMCQEVRGALDNVNLPIGIS